MNNEKKIQIECGEKCMLHKKLSLFIEHKVRQARYRPYLFGAFQRVMSTVSIYGKKQCSIHEFYMINTRCWQLILWKMTEVSSNSGSSVVSLALEWNRFRCCFSFFFFSVRSFIEYSIFAETTFVSKHLKFSSDREIGI